MMTKQFDSISGEIVKGTRTTQNNPNPQAAAAAFEFLLPDDILICILGKLDVRDIVICRCVCKRWKNLTSDQQFEESHLMKPSNLPRIVFKKSGNTYCIDKWWGKPIAGAGAGGTRLSTEIETLCDFKNGWQYSVNGFIVNWSDCEAKYVVSNPVTGKQVEIFLHDRQLPLHKATIIGIYFDPVRQEYCTLWLCTMSIDYGIELHTKYKLLNLGVSGCWREIGSHLWSHLHLPNTDVIYLDGFMYWIVIDAEWSKKKLSVMAFDIKTEDLSEIPLPAPSNNNNNIITDMIYWRSNLLNVDGSLCLVEVEDVQIPQYHCILVVKIWTLKDGRWWTASDYIISPEVQLAFFDCRAIAIVNKELVFQAQVGVNSAKQQLFVWNLQSGTLRKLGIRDEHRECSRCSAHYPSIASLKNCQRIIHIYV